MGDICQNQGFEDPDIPNQKKKHMVFSEIQPAAIPGITTFVSRS
jgi:hypothetical protein